MQSKSLYIAEKPSVAKEFAKVLNVGGRASDGYLESADAVVTWCVGHLVTMSYPEVYDPKLKKWSLDTLPFLPEEFKYELIDDVKKQFRIVERLLNREDVRHTMSQLHLLTQDSHPMHVRRHSILWQILWPHWAFLLYITIYSALSILRKFYIIICHFCLSHILSHLSSHEKFFRILFIRVIIHLSAFWCRQIKSY